MGIALVIYIFNFFCKTVCQIHFKLDGDVPWIDLYQVCPNGHGPLIFRFFTIFLGSFLGEIWKNLLQNRFSQLLWTCIGTLLGASKPKFVQPLALQFILVFFYELLCIFAILDFFSKTVSEIVLKLVGYVPYGRVKQRCSPSDIALNSRILTNFQFCYLSVNAYISIDYSIS